MLLNSKFRPAWWLRNPHVQTLWAAKIQGSPHPVTIKERVITPDDDFLDLNWTDNEDNTNQAVVLIFHGLTGSVHSNYVRSLMHYLAHHNIRAVLMHFRGCSDEPNKTAGSYHSGHTQDIRFIIDTVKDRYPNAPVAAVGYSLGGNALLKYLATDQKNALSFAVSVSPPLQLIEGAKRMNRGFSRLYQRVLLKQMRTTVRQKHKRYPQLGLDKLDFENTRNFFEFDHKVTAPLHGYDSWQDYYHRASTLHDLVNIRTPTHILWAQDDPFFSQKCIPTNAQLSPFVDFELSRHGGHVAFVAKRTKSDSYSWLSNRVGTLLTEKLGKTN